MTENPITPEITSEDKLWAMLAYVFSPIVPVILLLLEDKKDRPYIKEHNIQALVIGVLNAILAIPLSATIVLACIPMLIWLVMLYWGFQAYQGNSIEIPLVTKFVKDQGWA